MANAAQQTVTLSEAAGLIGVERHQIRNEIQRVLQQDWSGRRKPSQRHHFRFSEVLYFSVIGKLKVEGFDLFPGVRRELFQVLQKTAPASVGAWQRIDDLVRYEGKVPFEIMLHELTQELERTMRMYVEGKRLIVRDPEILGGEPIYSGTRIPVRQIVELFRRGAPAEEVRADYPTLPSEAIEYARIKARIGEEPGRPRKPLQVKRSAS